jgi:serine/threonine protein kinase
MAEAAELKALGRYTIERTLGKGAMGVVYEGSDPKLNRRVAIKTILKSHLDPDTAKDYSQRFSREAQAVARLNHPHIVQVYDFAEEGDVAYLVMEFIDGRELKHYFDAEQRFELKEAVRVMSELLDALEFAHSAGVIHRDVKPANVMLDAQGRTKLTDFGVARVHDPDRSQAERTQAGTMIGTPAYMSPEQITGSAIDHRSDLFSAGIILYQFLTGEKPFTGGGAWTIAKKIVQEDPPRPSSVNSAVTPHFDAVVKKALSKHPGTRYQSAKDFAQALKRALEGDTEAEDVDRTLDGEPAPPITIAPATTNSTATNPELELEFWRSIKDGTDPKDFELYVQQFPSGIYTALAKRKITKLRGTSEESTGIEARNEIEEAARREAEAVAKLAAEKEKLERELRKKEEELKRREAEVTAATAARRRSPLVLGAIAAGALAVAVGGYAFLAAEDAKQQAKMAEMLRQVEAAKRKVEETSDAQRAAAEQARAEARRQIAEARALAEKVKVETSGESLFREAFALERRGKGGDAVKVYARAAVAGNGKAAKRLGEIYDKGIAGVSRNNAESLKWYNAARLLGEEVPSAKNAPPVGRRPYAGTDVPER